MEPVGFHTYFKWNKEEFVEFLESNGFVVVEYHIMGGSICNRYGGASSVCGYIFFIQDGEKVRIWRLR